MNPVRFFFMLLAAAVVCAFIWGACDAITRGSWLGLLLIPAALIFFSRRKALHDLLFR